MFYSGLKAAALALAVCALSGADSAKAIVYNIDYVVVDNGLGDGNGTITGTITTDGTLGEITAIHITDWNLLLQVAGLSGTLTKANSVLDGNTSFAFFTVTDTTFSYDHLQDGSLFFNTNGGDSLCLSGRLGFCSDFSRTRILLPIPITGGIQSVLALSDPQQFVTYTADVSETPLPGALPLFATGLAGLGFIAHRRRRKQAA